MSDSTRPGQAGGTLSSDDVARMTGQIAALASAGMPLGSGLAALSEELPSGRLRRSLGDLSASLQAGTPLDQAVEQQREVLPPHLRGLVLGGMRSGRLGDVLGRYTGYVSVGTDIRRKLFLSLAYPALSIAVATCLFLFVSMVIVVMFESIFRDFGIPLPRMTMAILHVSRFARVLLPVLAILGVAFVAASILLRIFMSTSHRRGLLCGFPVFGRVWQYISWAEFCHLLALLLESSLPLPEALRLTGEGIENSNLDRACAVMAHEVENGQSLAQAMAGQRAFPDALPRLLKWSADQRSQSELLHTVGEMFEVRASSQASFAGTFMAVLSVIFVIVGLFTVVVGLLLPLLTLISALSG